jgi:DNA primase
LLLKDGAKDSPFGLDAVRGKHLVLVEGILDVLSLRARGEDAIGLGGSSLTEKQIEALTQARIQSLTVHLDNDDAGRHGTKRALTRLTPAPFPGYVMNPLDLEEVKDPDEYIRRYGIERWRDLRSQAVAAARYAGELLLQDVTPASPDCTRRAAVERILAYEASLFDYRAALKLDPALGGVIDHGASEEDATRAWPVSSSNAHDRVRTKAACGTGRLRL